MTYDPLLISLPVADRVRAQAFYRDGLGLDAIGEPADDGVPEPLMFVLNPTTRLMLVPTGGFGWVIGHHHVAEVGTSECVLGIAATTDDGLKSDRGACSQRRSDGRHRASATALGATRPRSPIPTATSGP